jgi:hypothetical protein
VIDPGGRCTDSPACSLPATDLPALPPGPAGINAIARLIVHKVDVSHLRRSASVRARVSVA